MTSQRPILPELLAIILFCLLLFCMVSCKCPCAAIPSGSLHDHDSVRTEYVHDSIYTDRWHTEFMRGDTLYIHDSIWRDRWHTKRDSVYVNNTDTIYMTVEVEKKGSAFWKGSGIALWVLIGCIVLGLIVGLIIKIAK